MKSLRVLMFLSLAVVLSSLSCMYSTDSEDPAEESPEPEVAVMRTQTAPTVAVRLDPAALEDPSRSEDDRKRDEGFKPLEVYGFFGVEPGLLVADLWPGRGYNTQILARAVGDQGRVLAILGPLYTQEKYVQRVTEAVNGRLEAGNITNVEVIGPLADVEENSVDVMITVRNYHDLGEAEDRIAVLPGVMRALKPGGILGVVDAATPKEGRDEENHRINEELVVKEITGAGFEFVASSDILFNPADDYEFDGREEDAPIHRYFIHRFVHKYRNPVE